MLVNVTSWSNPMWILQAALTYTQEKVSKLLRFLIAMGEGEKCIQTLYHDSLLLDKPTL